MATLRAGGIEIRYGDLIMLAEKRMLDECRVAVADYSPDERRRQMLSIDRSLRKWGPRVLKGRIVSKKHMDDLHADLLLWTALNEVSGS